LECGGKRFLRGAALAARITSTAPSQSGVARQTTTLATALQRNTMPLTTQLVRLSAFILHPSAFILLFLCA